MITIPNSSRGQKRRKLVGDKKYIPEELIEEILYKLPAKALIRFTSVSKSWNLLIRSPAFFTAHCCHFSTPEKPLLLINHLYLANWHIQFVDPSGKEKEDGGNNPPRLLPTPAVISGYKVVGSCNGLICLYNDITRFGHEEFYLWNPCIGKMLHLPQPPPQEYYPSLSPGAWYGFCFDWRDNDYKLLKISQVRNHAQVFELYSLNSNSWKIVDLDRTALLSTLRIYLHHISFAHGFFHFVAASRTAMPVNNVILGIDTVEEVILKIDLPECLQNVSFSSLYVLGYNNGSSIAVGRQFGAVRFDVWVMKSYGEVESWTKLFALSDTRMKCSPKVLDLRSNGEVIIERVANDIIHEFRRNCSVLLLADNGREDSPFRSEFDVGLGELFLTGGGSGLISFDLKSKRVKSLWTYPMNPKNLMRFSSICYYVKSLALLNTGSSTAPQPM